MKKYFKFFLYQMVRLKSMTKVPSVTLQYPFVKRKIAHMAKTSLRLDLKECTGCMACESICPVEAVQVIAKEFTDELVLPSSTNGHVFKKKVSQIRIDYGRCVFCGECVTGCESNALSFSKELPPVSGQVNGLIDSLVKTREIPKMAWRGD